MSLRMAKCAKCNAEYVEVEVDFECGDVTLRNVKVLKYPQCGKELFTTEQYRVVRERFDKKTRV